MFSAAYWCGCEESRDVKKDIPPTCLKHGDGMSREVEKRELPPEPPEKKEPMKKKPPKKAAATKKK